MSSFQSAYQCLPSVFSFRMGHNNFEFRSASRHSHQEESEEHLKLCSGQLQVKPCWQGSSQVLCKEPGPPGA